MRREEIIPSAARLTNSLRDLGYEFSNAVADLIDNSVTAGAGKVGITFHFDGPESWIRIVDDGSGMTGASVSEAMRLGTAQDYGEGDLGKFGLGLKTASLSQCRAPAKS
ncbi:ATP-binding protein [Micromonospora sp. WMMD980]|uniref:ATP-binding protein n=1 Tax=Micromonospora sp. WMMD980 TaxID=3016088 RepID=UPI002417CD12|nr:ATP-binding protein [Micromonospora sp. WMMD980]MDG4803560.1 ATP-binding protein [Micromonospora sp. WMMD980]